MARNRRPHSCLREAMDNAIPKLNALQEQLKFWIPQRDEVIKGLISIAEDIDETQQRTDTVTAVSGTATFGALGLCLIPGGVIMGLGIAAAGLVSVAGANIANAKASNSKVRKANDMMNKDFTGQSKIIAMIKELESEVKKLEGVYSEKDLSKLRAVIYTAKFVFSQNVDKEKYSWDIHSRLIKGVTLTEGGSTEFQPLAVMERIDELEEVMTSILKVVIVPLFIYDLIGCVSRLVNDERSEGGKKIRSKVREMRETRDNLDTLLNIIQRGAF